MHLPGRIEMNQISSTSTEVRSLPIKWIESLFERMLFEYGKKFSDQWGGSDPEALKAHWAKRLGDLNGEELKRGYGKLEGREWPPTLPEFRNLCRPQADSMVAYYEAVAGVQARQAGEMGTWSHPAIFWAAMPMAFDLGTQTFSQIKGRWEKALADQMERGEWAPVPAVMVALPAPGKSDLSREKAAKMLSDLGASNVLKPRTEHTIWYRNILARQKRGDRTLTMVQINFALEAAANHGYQA